MHPFPPGKLPPVERNWQPAHPQSRANQLSNLLPAGIENPASRPVTIRHAPLAQSRIQGIFLFAQKFHRKSWQFLPIQTVDKHGWHREYPPLHLSGQPWQPPLVVQGLSPGQLHNARFESAWDRRHSPAHIPLPSALPWRSRQQRRHQHSRKNPQLPARHPDGVAGSPIPCCRDPYRNR